MSVAAIYKPAIVIRPLTRYDMPDIEHMFQEAYNGRPDLPKYDADHCWMQLIGLARQGNVVVAEVDGQPMGLIALHITSWPWNPNARMLENIHFYVAKKYRRYGIADKLRDAAKDVARRVKLPLHLRMTYGTEPDKLERWGEMGGFSVVGVNLIWTPE